MNKTYIYIIYILYIYNIYIFVYIYIYIWQRNKTRLSGTQTFMWTLIYILHADNNWRYIFSTMCCFISSFKSYHQLSAVVDASIFNLNLLWWWQRKTISDRLFKWFLTWSSRISNFLFRHKLHLLEMGL